MTVCAVILGANILFTVPSATPALFRGYTTVYYRGQRPLAEVVGFLRQQADIDVIVSRETAEVLYTDFSGLASVPLAQLGTRFDPLDPRLDDYLKRLDRYFLLQEDAADWNVFYVSTRRNPLYLSLLTRQVAGTVESDWYICELDRRETTVFLAVLGTAFFFFLMLLSSKPVYHVFLTAGSLPWLHALAGNGIGNFMLFFFLAGYWAFFLREYLDFSENMQWHGWKENDKKPLFLRLGLLGGVLLMTFLYTAAVGRNLSDLILALTGLAGLIGVHWLALRGLRFLKEKKHLVLFRGFAPLTILRRLDPRKPFSPEKGFEIHALVILLCLIPLALFFQPVPRIATLPFPRALSPSSGINLQSIRRLSQMRSPGDLPDLSDFVRHAAFQERLAYEDQPQYAIPASGDKIEISEYRLSPSGTRIERQTKIIEVFDDRWLSGLAAKAGASSVEKMLFAQGQCLTVAFRRAGPGDFFGQTNWTIIIIFSIVLTPIILIEYTTMARIMYRKRKRPGKGMRKKR
jgi:hypothetical protein